MTRWITLSLGFLAACGAADAADTEKAPLPPLDEPDRPREPSAADSAADKGCPTALEGVQVTSEVTSEGAALVFVIDGGDVAELRTRVNMLASRYNERQIGASIAAVATVEETGNGARLLLEPSDPTQLGALREHVRVHGQEMAAGNCGAAGEESAPASVPPATTDEPAPIPGEPEPTPAPTPSEPIIPDRPVTPDQPVTPPTPPDQGAE